uniref:Uncharacterized protein n=1 Tax=Hyaloperonospora arabidopsidis (strain Emoy2) TaxID=559515 RepID=M4BWR2_HYAAE
MALVAIEIKGLSSQTPSGEKMIDGQRCMVTSALTDLMGARYTKYRPMVVVHALSGEKLFSMACVYFFLVICMAYYVNLHFKGPKALLG